jgi:hypothetical protein
MALTRYPGYITDFLEGKKGKKREPHGTSLRHFRDTELDPTLAAQLLPFINAYRPHDEVPSRDELKEEGYELVRVDTFTDDLRETYWELRGYYPEENPELEEGE